MDKECRSNYNSVLLSVNVRVDTRKHFDTQDNKRAKGERFLDGKNV